MANVEKKKEEARVGSFGEDEKQLATETLDEWEYRDSG